jgi:hypothetical protein
MPHKSLGIALILAGVMIILIGGLAWLGALSWFGRLPGDIRIERPGFRLYAPIASMLLVSLLFSALLGLLRKLGS